MRETRLQAPIQVSDETFPHAGAIVSDRLLTATVADRRREAARR
jgi:hypothetical protein